MLLETHTVAWMQRHLVASAAADDLQRAYSFAHELNARQECKKVTQHEANADSGPRLRWHVLVYCNDGRCILDGSAPISRSVVGAARLHRTGEVGLVARNEHVALAVPFQKRGFATALYSAEEELYRRWGVREIHLTALSTGRHVWMTVSLPLPAGATHISGARL